MYCKTYFSKLYKMKQNIIFFLFFSVMLCYGQKMEILKGDVKSLKGITQFDVVFDYNDIQIPNCTSEEDFLAKKVAIRERKSKEAGELFREKWFSNRKEFYEPKFIDSFNKWFRKEGNSISKNANYIIKVHIVKMYSGYNVVAANQYAKIGAVISVYTKENPENILFEGAYETIKGGKTYKEHERISRCFFNLAKNLSLYILRKSK